MTHKSKQIHKGFNPLGISLFSMCIKVFGCHKTSQFFEQNQKKTSQAPINKIIIMKVAQKKSLRALEISTLLQGLVLMRCWGVQIIICCHLKLSVVSRSCKENIAWTGPTIQNRLRHKSKRQIQCDTTSEMSNTTFKKNTVASNTG